LNGFLKVKYIHCNKENAAGIRANERLHEHNVGAAAGIIIGSNIWCWLCWYGGGGSVGFLGGRRRGGGR